MWKQEYSLQQNDWQKMQAIYTNYTFTKNDINIAQI